MPLPEHASYQKDKLLILTLTVSMSKGSPMILERYGNKGPHQDPNKNGEVNDLLVAILLPFENSCHQN